MKLLSQLAGLSTALLLSAVALSGTAYARVPPEDSDAPARAVPGADGGPPQTVEVVVGTGLPALQVVVLVLCAAVAATVVTAIVTRRRLPRTTPYPAGRPRPAS